MIRVRDLHKYYEGHHLFKGINLDIEKGEVVVFIGPSGSGKSTFLRCINGLEYFQKGEIIVDGIELHSINRLRPDSKRLRKHQEGEAQGRDGLSAVQPLPSHDCPGKYHRGAGAGARL